MRFIYICCLACSISYVIGGRVTAPLISSHDIFGEKIARPPPIPLLYRIFAVEISLENSLLSPGHYHPINVSQNFHRDYPIPPYEFRPGNPRFHNIWNRTVHKIKTRSIQNSNAYVCHVWKSDTIHWSLVNAPCGHLLEEDGLCQLFISS